ncbi:hypothetical protein [Azohydromonas lata]|uniref:Uncharacterized protein n=1 Tax=Azohydromonas lata TaxID=45677 RepID=A0ABU5IK40_9BURK|nr:hypothetical protein [Azohydromonas lata]MDZ5459264.1 hypothetical protein [Azohydromonas lata]
MSTVSPAEAQRALLAQVARERAAERVHGAGDANPFSPGCDTALNVLRYELQRIERLTPEQLLHGAQRAV